MRLVEVQLSHLVTNVNKKNETATKEEILQLLGQFGSDAAEHYGYSLLKACAPGGKVRSGTSQAALLTSFVKEALDEEDTSVTLVRAIGRWEASQREHGKALGPAFLADLTKGLSLTDTQQLLLAAECIGSPHSALQASGRQLWSSVFPALASARVNADKTPAKLVHRILAVLHEHQTSELGITDRDRANFIDAVSSAFTGKHAEPWLLPLLLGSDGNIMTEPPPMDGKVPANIRSKIEPSSLLRDVGFAATASLASARDFVSSIPSDALTDHAIGRCIGVMASTCGQSDPGAGMQVFGATSFDKDGHQPSQEHDDWNPNHFVDAVMKAKSPAWAEVIAGLDFEGLSLSDSDGLALIVKAFRRGAPQASFPVNLLFSEWVNIRGQLSLLRQLVLPGNATLPHVTWLLSQTGNKVSLDGLKALQYAEDPSLSPWLHVDLVSALLRIGESMYYSDVEEIFKHAFQNYPEALALSLTAASPRTWTSIQNHFMRLLFNFFLVPRTNSSVILQRVWTLRKPLLVKAMIEWYHTNNQDMSSLGRILDIAQDLKALVDLYDASDLDFVVEFAVLSSGREFVNLDGWLSDRLARNPVGYGSAVLSYLSRRLVGSSEGLQLQPNVVESLLRSMDKVASQLTPEMAQRYVKVRDALAGLAAPNVAARLGAGAGVPPPVSSSAPAFAGMEPSMTPPGLVQQRSSSTGQQAGQLPPGASVPSLPPGQASPLARGAVTSGDFGALPELTSQSFSESVDHSANLFFKKIYQGQMPIENVISLLQQLKASASLEEQQVFACMIRNLFDEYQFFGQYPDKELNITGLLFGAIIQHGLVAGRTLAGALDYILNAVNNNRPGSKMHRFGLITLRQIQMRLQEWPDFCASLLKSPALSTFPVEVAAALTSSPPASGAAPVAGADQAPVNSPASGTTSSAPDASVQPDTSSGKVSDEKPIEEPPTIVSNKVSIVFNNLAANNLNDKKRDLLTVLEEKYYPWFAKYLVTSRVVTEGNYHDLYMKFVLSLESAELEKAILTTTYRVIDSYLSPQKLEAAGSSERSVLKLLGNWLGLQTLARNKPILHKHLALKKIIVDFYRQGHKALQTIVPFAAKVLETAKHSTIFRPPNPWTMAHLRVLREIHVQPALKLSIKFEVEVLCKNLGIKIEDISASDILARSVRASPKTMGTSPEMSSTAPEFHPRSMSLVNNFGTGVGAPGPQQQAPNPFPLLQSNNVASLHQYIKLSPELPLLQTQPGLKEKLVPVIDKAIQDILGPVVDRSVKIACISCQKLIGKDLVYEPDISKFRAAATNMAQHLAGRLAMVTAKDPLHISMAQQIKNALIASIADKSAAAASQVEKVAATIAGDNMELGSTFVELVARERAAVMIGDTLKSELADRAQFQERVMATGQRTLFIDPNHAPQSMPAIPQLLLPSVNTMGPGHWELYQHFSVQPRIGGPSQGSSSLNAQAAPFTLAGSTATAQGAGAFGHAKPEAPPGQQRQQSQQQQQQQQQPSQELMQIKATLDRRLSDIQPVAEQYSGQSLAQATVMQTVLKDIVSLVKQLPPSLRLETTIALGQRVATLLFDESTLQNKLLSSSLIYLLANFREDTPQVSQIVTKQYLSVADDRKLNAPDVSHLATLRLLDLNTLDNIMQQVMQNGHNTQGVLFVEDVLRRCLLPPHSPSGAKLDPSHFPNSIATLRNIALTQQPKREQQMSLLASIERLQASTPAAAAARGRLIKEDPNDPDNMRDQVAQLFTEWTMLSQQAKPGDAAVPKYIRKLTATVLSSGDLSSRFFRMCTDLSVQLCFKVPPVELMAQGSATEPQLMSFGPVDIFCQLIVVLLKHFGESTKVALVKKVLSTVTHVVAREHSIMRGMFNQKPFMRLFVNLLTDVSASDEAINLQVLTSFSHAFHSLRPAVVPGFTFAWLDLVASRQFMPKLLAQRSNSGKSWQLFQLLLADLLTYLEPHLRRAKLSEPISVLYKSTLRVFLVLLHDFPEFLCENHFTLCDIIPPTCVQLRNLVLSAFPATMRLPDPFSPDLRVSQLPEVAQPPRIMANFATALQATQLQEQVDRYFAARKPVPFLSELQSRLLLPPGSPGSEAGASRPTVNVPLLNSLVLYTGVKAIEQAGAGNQDVMTHGPAMDIFQHLILNLNAEGRYHLINGLANQLRYPNSHTHYFSNVILALFREAGEDAREQITRVLFERMIANRPHPWGLLVTFVELVKVSDFWSHNFVRLAPEIERLFRSIIQSFSQGSRPQASVPLPPKSADAMSS